ncbi:MAG: large-conductance mechanosensitive channel protein MscL [Ignavibacteria bacterium]|nr:large-conductance mechanosensitive channel protein MscL [Ignavibacteria bacterium]
MIDEFKEFATAGNVLDLAIGIIIGGAFGKIVSSFVNDILMPPLGLLIGGYDFSSYKIVLKLPLGSDQGVAINYGKFINTTIDFLIITFAIFILIKSINRIKRQIEEKEKKLKAVKTSREIELLTEIRDLLKK